jgi:ubiquinone/menaquinone biosynthesis C-methylase UbiE
MPRMSTFERGFCQSPPWRAFTRRLVLPWALQGVRPGGHVVEIGSGSGTMAAEILDAFPDIHLTATDIDPAMVRDGEVRLARFGERAGAREASATELPFADESFDIVLSFIMLHHVVDWQRALGEALRVLRPGGTLDLPAATPASSRRPAVPNDDSRRVARRNCDAARCRVDDQVELHRLHRSIRRHEAASSGMRP